MRRRDNALVPNEEHVLLGALTLHYELGSFHGYAMRNLWATSEDSRRSMNYATLYRCLDRLDEQGLLKSTIDDDPDKPSRPRRMFTLTGEGLRVASALEAAVATSIEPGPAIA